MKVIKIPAGIYAVNCYVVYSEKTKAGIIVDPGGDADDILKRVKDLDLDIKYLILTHGHGDHIGGVNELKEKLNTSLLVHADDEAMIKDPEMNLSTMMAMGPTIVTADKVLKDGDIIEFGDIKAEVIHTPGHTKGGICLKIGGILISGDTLFKGSIGRTDLAGGNYDALIKSIREKLLILDDDVVVLPGHGESSTILAEKQSNSFLV